MISHPRSFFIDGQWVQPSGAASVVVTTASTERPFIEVAEADAFDVHRAVAAARQAFDKGVWPRMSHRERAGYLEAIARGIKERAGDFSHIWTSEVGVVKAMADFVALRAADTYDYYASLADEYPFIERHKPQSGGNVGLLVREPVGVVGAIVPWNAPLSLMTYKLAPALLAGCTVVIKASPEAPGSAYVMAEVIERCGLPPGVVNVITADREVSELLVRHPDVDKISFTGSSEAGKRIASICGERMARCTLELGGKSAAVVLDDADVETVARTLAQSARIMSGQVCASLTRIIVSRDRQKDLVDAMAANFSAIKVGDPFQSETEMGPVATRRQRSRVESYIASGKEQGAKIAAGGDRPAHMDRGFYLEPTLFFNVDNDMKIAREEIFGPVVSIIPAENEQNAVMLANDSVFGLNASVFTQDSQRAYEVARELRSGTVGHNAMRGDFRIAFGGFKQSGIGREGGREGLHPYLEVKTIILDEEPDLTAGAA